MQKVKIIMGEYVSAHSFRRLFALSGGHVEYKKHHKRFGAFSTFPVVLAKGATLTGLKGDKMHFLHVRCLSWRSQNAAGDENGKPFFLLLMCRHFCFSLSDL